MSIVVYIAMYGWVIVSIRLFFIYPPQKAAIVTIIGGVLFLPSIIFDIPGFPAYSKTTAISLGLVLGGILSGNIKNHRIEYKPYDILMMIYCFFVPLATSFTNGLSLKDGVSNVLGHYLSWGVFYWTGRRYFTELDYFKQIIMGLAIGGLLYMPLVFFEVRMSPQLSNMVYGFFPHSFLQHLRYGGYRPIVFMNHGLMVALWMAICTTVIFWLWRTKELTKIFNIPIAVLTLLMIAGTIVCKSAGAWLFLFLGIVVYFLTKLLKTTSFLRFLLLMIPLYMIARLGKIISAETVQHIAERFFDAERVGSLGLRLLQEDLFGEKALQRMWFGWGGYGRGWPVDPITGEKLIEMVDSFWIITMSSEGIIGLLCIFGSLGIGPWLILSKNKAMNDKLVNQYKSNLNDGIILSIVVIFFMLDTLVNAMVNPIYIFCAGSLINYYLKMQELYRST